MPVHHLMVGTWTPPGAIFVFAFDDVALTLQMVNRTTIPVDEPISWMTLSHDKKTIYGAAGKAWSSYAVESPNSIVHQVSFPMPHDLQACSPDADTRAIFLLASSAPPHAVYCNPFYSRAGAGSVFSVDESSGALAQNVQNFAYQPESGVHGTVFHPDGRHLYSADLSANRIWVHRRRDDSDHGPPSPELDLVHVVAAPDPRDHPRWVAVHPSGTALYVLMEAGNRVCEYAISSSSPLPVFTGRQFSLAPPQEAHEPVLGFRGDVCALSHSGSYLFASTRAADPDRPGYLAAFELSPEGRLERRLLLQPTTTSGGHSNAVSPSDWTDEWLAVVEDQSGFLDIHRWRDHSLERVARIQVSEPGFGMNAIWYD